MAGLKRTIAAALLLAFVAGLGAGAWMSDLRAAPRKAATPSADRRADAFQEKYDLTASQRRRVRDIIVRYDQKRRSILTELDSERWQRIERLAAVSRQAIDEILREEDGPGSTPGG
ncbi:MAG: hypothetical protein AAGD14_14690 [Planctomycetota bacterium]